MDKRQQQNKCLYYTCETTNKQKKTLRIIKNKNIYRIITKQTKI